MTSTTQTFRSIAVRGCGAVAVVCVLACAAPTRGDDPAPVVDPVAVTVEASPEEDDAAIRAGIDQVRRSLGGSTVDRFPMLQRADDAPVPAPAESPRRMFRKRPDGTSSRVTGVVQSETDPTPPNPPSWSASPMAPLVSDAVAPISTTYTPPVLAASPVNALRAAAAELEVSANRLEHLELYRNADALRALAQELRLDARLLANGASPADEPFDPATYGASSSDPPRTGWSSSTTDVSQ